MKSSIVYIIGGIVLFIGILLAVIGFSLSGFNYNKLNNDPGFTEKSFVSTQAITAINAEDENVSVDIIESNDDKVHITYYENSSTQYNITEENGVINLSVHKTFKITGIFNFNFESVKLVIEVPRGYDGKLNISTSNAAIFVSRVTASDVYLKTSNGHVDTDFLIATGDIEITSSNGRIELSNTSGNDFTVETSNGKIEIVNITAQEGIELKTSNGSISFDSVDYVSELRCKSSNASIDGTLPGNMTDYSIISDTSNGNNSLPSDMNSGDKKLNVKTSNGSIDIEFEN